MKFFLILLLLGSPAHADRYTITQGIASGQLEIRDAQGRVVAVTQRLCGSPLTAGVLTLDKYLLSIALATVSL